MSRNRIVKYKSISGVITYQPQRKFLFWWFNLGTGLNMKIFHTREEALFFIEHGYSEVMEIEEV